LDVADKLKINKKRIVWVFSFRDMFDKVVENNWIWIVPIENSYAGSVHENFYHLVSYPVEIIGEYYLEVSHCLASVWNDLKKIKKVYSHPQALMQCENYLKSKWIQPLSWWDTAWSAKYVKQLNDPTVGAICSELAAEIYWLNILDRWINDQKGNTTRFFIIKKSDKFLEYRQYWSKSQIKLSSDRFLNEKMSIVFKVKDMPAVLFKCLWAFATRAINLTKIESLPAKQWPFEYMFWLDFELPKDKSIVDWALEELKFFAKDVRILGVYERI
jgi:prephenate dehydratase